MKFFIKFPTGGASSYLTIVMYHKKDSMSKPKIKYRKILNKTTIRKTHVERIQHFDR